MATLTRLNLAYLIASGIFARSIIDNKYIDFDKPELVGQSLVLLGSLTSLLAGFLIALQLHIYLNNLILDLAGRRDWIKYYELKTNVSRKKDFSSTLDEFYGNILILIILFCMLLSFIFDFEYINLCFNHK